MEAEDDEFFEAYEEIPPSPRLRIDAGSEGFKEPSALQLGAGEAAERRGGEFSQGRTPVPPQLEADLSVWKAGPSSVRDRREKFWQNVKQGKGPRPVLSQSSAGSSPKLSRLASESQAGASDARDDNSRRKSAGEGIFTDASESTSPRSRGLSFGSSVKAEGRVVGGPVQQSTLTSDLARGRQDALAVSSHNEHALGQLSATSACGPGPAASGPTDDSSKLRPQTSKAPSTSSTTSADHSASPAPVEVSALEPSTQIKPQQDVSVLGTVQDRNLPQTGTSLAPIKTSTGNDGIRPTEARGPFQTLPIPVPSKKPPFARNQLTENARPWPKRHHRTPSQSDNDATPTTSPPAGSTGLGGLFSPSQLASLPRELTRVSSANERPGSGTPAAVSVPAEASNQSDGAEQLAGGVIRVQDKEYAVDVVYRVKDLDTGKEFIVDEANGTSSKVKDLSSGQELSYNEFEDRLGLSPIMREVERRMGRGADNMWDAAGGGQESESSSQGGEPIKQKKKKGWLKTLKKGAEYYSSIGSRIGKDYIGGGGTRSDPEVDQKSMSDKDSKGVKFARHRRIVSNGSEPASVTGWGAGFEAGPYGARSVKVHVHRKLYKELTDVRLGQEIKAHTGAIWCMKFNADGHFLATGGADAVVRVWEVVLRLPPTPLQADDFPDTPSSAVSALSRRNEQGSGEYEAGDEGPRSRRNSGEGPKGESWGNSFWLADVPYRSLIGHTADILDVSWSKNTQFLLSSSMDKTVRLWHSSMDECLRVFPHSDYVTCVEFNPVDDKYFVSGSLDNKLRIWNIPEHHVEDWTDMREMVTACTYTQDGKGVIAGSYEGTCRFYNASGHKLLLDAHIEVKSTRGKNAHGKKITGVQCMPGDSRKILVTSNDSRIRVYDGMKLQCKYKGHKNANSQIQATSDGSGGFLVCASEDSYVYIWNTVNSFVPSNNPVYTGYRKDKHQSYEYFYSQGTNVAIFWPGLARPLKEPRASLSSKNKCSKPSEDILNHGESTTSLGTDAAAEATSLVGGQNERPNPGKQEVLLDKGVSSNWFEDELRCRHTPFKSTPSPGPGPWAVPIAESDKVEDVATVVAEAHAAGEAAVAAATGVGLVVITAGYGGELRTFKNFGYPAWL